MIIEPRMRGFICLTSHPKGCEQNVINQIEYVKSKGAINGAKKVLVIGASTGFGLASRITSAFGSDAATIGVFFEKPPTEGKTASRGGIIQQLSKMKLTKQDYTLKVSTEMLFLMR